MVICARDLPGTGDSPDWRGLRLAQEAGPVCTALPVWNWGEVYIRLARSILRGGWDELSAAAAVNYWWGFANAAVDVRMMEALPDGPRELVQILRAALIHGELAPFHRHITDQTGTVRNNGDRWLPPEGNSAYGLAVRQLCAAASRSMTICCRWQSRWCVCWDCTARRSSRRKGGRCFEASAACR